MNFFGDDWLRSLFVTVAIEETATVPLEIIDSRSRDGLGLRCPDLVVHDLHTMAFRPTAFGGGSVGTAVRAHQDANLEWDLVRIGHKARIRDARFQISAALTSAITGQSTATTPFTGFSLPSRSARRGGRAVECTGLENRHVSS